MTRLGPLVRLVTVGLFAAVLFAGIAVALQMCVRLPRAHGAPLPPPPKLSAEILVGKWDLRWGINDCKIWFAKDGTFALTVGNGEGPFWHGTWCVRDGALELTKWAFDPTTRCNSEPSQYQFELDMKQFPTISAKGPCFVLRDPVR